MMRIVIAMSVLAMAFAPVTMAEGDDDHGHGHGEDFIIGVNGAGEIAVEYDADIYPLWLPASPEPLLGGRALDDPGLIGLHEAEPEEDFYPLAEGSEVGFVLVAADPAFKVWDPNGPGEDGFQVGVGDTFSLGDAHVHTHLWWNIDTTDPAWSAGDEPWDVTFQIVDLRDPPQYAASAPVTVGFVPEPSAMVLLVIAGLAIRRR